MSYIERFLRWVQYIVTGLALAFLLIGELA